MGPAQGVEFVLGLLVAMVALATLGRRLGVPAPILFVLGGLVLGLVPGLPQTALAPDLVLLLFLPPLLYVAGVFAPYRALRSYLRPLLLLAIGLVVATMAAVAVVAHAAIPGVGWAPAFVLGAIVAPTDTELSLAIAQRLPVPRRVAVLLEGEGLFNDAASLTLYKAAVAAAVTGAFSLAPVGLTFVAAGLGGIMLGAVVGALAALLRRRLNDPLIEATVGLLTPFAAWIPAEAVGASGALAVVVAGMYVGRARYLRLPAGARLQISAFWEVIAFLLEGLLFILTGLQLRGALRLIPGPPRGVVADVVVVSATVVGVRLLWVFAEEYCLPGCPRPSGARVPWSEAAVIGAAGARGTVSLALALALPTTAADGRPFPARETILFLTASVVLVTLLLEGLGLLLLGRALGGAGTVTLTEEERLGRRRMIEVGLARLDELAAASGVSDEALHELRARLQRRRSEEAEAQAAEDAARLLLREVLAAERQEALRLRDQGLIGSEVLRRILHDLDLEEAALDGRR